MSETGTLIVDELLEQGCTREDLAFWGVVESVDEEKDLSAAIEVLQPIEEVRVTGLLVVVLVMALTEVQALADARVLEAKTDLAA